MGVGVGVGVGVGAGVGVRVGVGVGVGLGEHAGVIISKADYFPPLHMSSVDGVEQLGAPLLVGIGVGVGRGRGRGRSRRRVWVNKGS